MALHHLIACAFGLVNLKRNLYLLEYHYNPYCELCYYKAWILAAIASLSAGYDSVNSVAAA